MILDIVFSISKFLEDRYILRYIFILTAIKSTSIYLLKEELRILFRNLLINLEDVYNNQSTNIDIRLLKGHTINIYNHTIMREGMGTMSVYNRRSGYNYYIFDNISTNKRINIWNNIGNILKSRIIPPSSNVYNITWSTRMLSNMGFFNGLDIYPDSIRIPLKYINDTYYDNYRRIYDFEDKKRIVTLHNPNIEDIIDGIRSVRYYDPNETLEIFDEYREGQFYVSHKDEIRITLNILSNIIEIFVEHDFDTTVSDYIEYIDVVKHNDKELSDEYIYKID